MNSEDFINQQGTLQIDSARYQNYNSILERAELQDGEGQFENDIIQPLDFNTTSQNYNVKVIGGDNNLSKNKQRKTKPIQAPPTKMICVRNSVLENEVFPVIADENLDPDDLNNKINYGINDDFSKMDAKMVKIVQSKMKLEAIKKRQQQYQMGIQRQMDEKQAKQQKSRNAFLDHRIKHCQQQSKKWQDRKQNHDNFMLEKEILKQIMQDEYLVTQQEFWQRRDVANSQSQQLDIDQQSLNKSTQHFQRNSVNQNIQAGKPPKDAFRPDTANTVTSHIHSNDRQFKRLSQIEKQNERNEMIKGLNLIGDRIGTNRSYTAGTSYSVQGTNKQIFSSSFYNASNQNRQNNSSQIRRESSLQSNSQAEPLKQPLRNNLINESSVWKESQFAEDHSKYTQKIEPENPSQSNFQNNLFQEINIQRDFFIADPFTRSIIQESFTQPYSKKNLSLDQNALVSDNQNRQTTPSSFYQTKPRFSNFLKTPSVAINSQVTPISNNQPSTKYLSISPANGNKFSFKKQEQKLSYDKRRYQCLNKIYQSKVNQLNQDEVFTDKMRKQKMQDLVRRKISANFPGNYKLKINFSLVEKLDEQSDNVNQQDSSSNLQQTLYQQNSVNNNSQQQTSKAWNTQSHQISRNRQNYPKENQKRFKNNSFNLYHNDQSSDEDGDDVIKYIKNL